VREHGNISISMQLSPQLLKIFFKACFTACSASCDMDGKLRGCHCQLMHALVEERLGESLEEFNQQKYGLRGVQFPSSVRPGGGLLTVAEWLSLCLSMLDCVSGLHKHCVVHGDIKLANFCLSQDEDGRQIVKVIDLGAICT
jgi:serine/threonine protein kinase